MIGRTIAHYAVTEKIGAGGMGEVYRARDTRLNREVALKVLPPVFFSDPQRAGRFQREAQVLASLNHPNIAAIYGVEEAGDTRALVLELVEGADLSERMAAGPVPFDEAVDIARQVAEAMEVAHESGVVHRDLKPGNIKITPAGQVKVLDFGLAKALEGEKTVSGPDASMSPTLTAAATQAGVVLGTAAYMSPEQAKGKAVDRRADIFSFGVVLFEMLCAKRLFSGETVSETLAAVIKDEPDWSLIPTATHPAVTALIRRCLEKDPRRRLQSIGEARVLLETLQRGDATLPVTVSAGPAEGGNDAITGGPGAKVISTGGWWALAVMVIAVLALQAWTATRKSGEGGAGRRITFEIEAEDLAVSSERHPVLSPDGRRIAYVAQGDIWIRDLEGREPRRIEGTQRARHLTWSPGGESLAFATGNRLMEIQDAGGVPTQISTLPVGSLDGLAWTDDGWIWFAGGVGPMYRVPARGGDTEEAIPPGESDFFDFHPPAALPGGAIVYVVHRKAGSDTIEAFRDGKRKVVLRIEGAHLAAPRYGPGGFLLYHRTDRNDGVWAVPFDPQTLERTGEPFLVAVGGRYPAAAAVGMLLYTDPGETPLRQLVEVDREGRILRAIGEPRPGLRQIIPSPDGREAMVSVDAGEGPSAWRVDLQSGEFGRLVSLDRPHEPAAWVPGGEQVALQVGSGGMDSHIVLYRLDGRGEPRDLGEGTWPSFTPDGEAMVFTALVPGTAADVLVLDLMGEEGPRPYIQTEKMEGAASLSPDGRYLLYLQGEGNLPEIYLTTFPERQGTWRVSSGKGFWPMWSVKGDEVFYTDPQAGAGMGDLLVAVPVQTSPEVRIGRGRDLFSAYEHGIQEGTSWRHVAPMPDGRSFLAVQLQEDESSDPPVMVVIQNWLAGNDPRDD